MDGFSRTRSLTIEWGHCDPAGIVFNPRFFEYFDWSTALLVEAASGHGKHAMLDVYGLVGIPVVETGAKFMAPCRYGDTVSITSTVVELKRSSFRVRHRLYNGQVLSVEGEEVRVWSGRHPDDPARMKSMAIPDEVALRLRGG